MDMTRRNFLGVAALGAAAPNAALAQRSRTWTIRDTLNALNQRAFVPLDEQIVREGRALAYSRARADDFWGTNFLVQQDTGCDHYRLVVYSEGIPEDPSRQLVVNMDISAKGLRFARDENHPLTHIVPSRADKHFVAFYMDAQPEIGTDGEPAKRVDNIITSPLNPRLGNREQRYTNIAQDLNVHVGQAAFPNVYSTDVADLEGALRLEAEIPYLFQGRADPKSAWTVKMDDAKYQKSGLPVWKVQVFQYGSPSNHADWPQSNPDLLLTAYMGLNMDGKHDANHLVVQRDDNNSEIGGRYAEFAETATGNRQKITTDDAAWARETPFYLPNLRLAKGHPEQGFTRAELLGEKKNPVLQALYR